jgi:hypothetical protein
MLFAAIIAPGKPDELGIRLPLQSTGQLGFLVLHSCCISYESEIQSNRDGEAGIKPVLEEQSGSSDFMGFHVLSRVFQGAPEQNVTDFCYRSPVLRESANRKSLILNWLPPRDSNPDMLIQSQLS